MQSNVYKLPEITSSEQRKRLIVEMTEFVDGLAPWSVFVTITFARSGKLQNLDLGYTADYVEKRYLRLMRNEFKGVSHCYVLEGNPDYLGRNPGFHVHALWCDLPMKRKEAWQICFDECGFSKILPIVPFGSLALVKRNPELLEVKFDHNEGTRTVLNYCAKYVVKNMALWNVELKNLRLMARVANPADKHNVA